MRAGNRCNHLHGVDQYHLPCPARLGGTSTRSGPDRGPRRGGLERTIRGLLTVTGLVLPFLLFQFYVHGLIWIATVWAVAFRASTERDRGSMARPIRRKSPVFLTRGWPALLLGLGACGSATGPEEAARYRIRESSTSAVFRIEITSADAIAEAEALRASGEARWVLGKPRRGDGGFNDPWSWSLDPATIGFGEVTIEACQATAAMVGGELDYWIGFGQLCLHGVIEGREGPAGQKDIAGSQ